MIDKKKYYIGLMSGTSADGIDLTLVSFDTDNRLIHHASYYQPYDTEIALKITNLYTPDNNEIDRAFSLDIELAKIFTVAIKNFLSRENLNSKCIITSSFRIGDNKTHGNFSIVLGFLEHQFQSQ